MNWRRVFAFHLRQQFRSHVSSSGFRPSGRLLACDACRLTTLPTVLCMSGPPGHIQTADADCICTQTQTYSVDAEAEAEVEAGQAILANANHPPSAATAASPCAAWNGKTSIRLSVESRLLGRIGAVSATYIVCTRPICTLAEPCQLVSLTKLKLHPHLVSVAGVRVTGRRSTTNRLAVSHLLLGLAGHWAGERQPTIVRSWPCHPSSRRVSLPWFCFSYPGRPL